MRPSLRYLAFACGLSFAASLPSPGAGQRASEVAGLAWAEPSPAKQGAPAQAPVTATAAGASANPVQNEMQLLHEAARDWVSAIANHTLGVIPVSIGKVHGARLLTEQAVQAGRYRPPKNGAALADFVKQDEAFHGELVKLLRAARANDLPAATQQLGVVLTGCTSCHLRFRF